MLLTSTLKTYLTKINRRYVGQIRTDNFRKRCSNQIELLHTTTSNKAKSVPKYITLLEVGSILHILEYGMYINELRFIVLESLQY